jgi:cytoskeletal protein RodZ
LLLFPSFSFQLFLLDFFASFLFLTMVCLGPRKKEKKNNLLSPDDAQTSRGLKKSSTSKLKSSKTKEATPSNAASLKKPASRTSLEKTNTGLPRPSSRNSLLSNGVRGTATPSHHRPTSPPAKVSSRPSSMVSVKSIGPTRNGTVTTTTTARTSRTPSNASTASGAPGAPGAAGGKRFPITEMKEEVKDLKAKVIL